MKKFERFYSKNYKKFFIIPILIVVIAIFILGNNFNKTGDIVQKDVSLQGGLTITITTNMVFPELEDLLLERFPESDINLRTLSEFGSKEQKGILIEATKLEDGDLKPVLEELMGIPLTDENYSSEFMGSTLGDAFYKQMSKAILLAFIFMAVAITIIFRSYIPSLAVIFAAFSDMTITLAILNLFNLKLSTAGIAALLLLIGYSVDTDILLTTKMLKRKDEGPLFQRMIGALKTGLTMTSTTVFALIVGYFLSNSYVIKEIFLIIIIGLFVDVMITYCMNAGLLWWYVRKKNG